MDTGTRRLIQDLQAGRRAPIGLVTLSTGTTTVVQTQACSKTSHVCLHYLGLTAPAQTVYGFVPDTGFFTIGHSASATPSTYSWEVSTGSNINA